MKENKNEKKERQCIVINNSYKSYYYGGASYGDDFLRAKVYNKSELPDYIKNDPDEKIIFLDTKEGLELLVKEFKNNQDYVKIYGPRVKEAEETMKKLFKFDSVRKYIERHNKWNHHLIGISRETENKIIEEIVGETANSN
jgi:hypothetical protein